MAGEGSKPRRRKRGQNEGSNYETADGRLRGAVSAGRKEDGSLKRVYVSGRTRSEVQRKIKELLHSTERGLPIPDRKITVGVWLQRWVDEIVPGTVAARTEDHYAGTVRRHLIPGLGRHRLVDLQPHHVDAFLESKAKAGQSANSRRVMRSALRPALHEAERQGFVSRNVASLAKSIRIPRGQSEGFALEQLRQLLEFAERDQWARPDRFLWLVIATYGLRVGEAVGLEWEDLDPRRGVLHVRRAIKRVGRKVLIEDTKTSQSRRTLPLTRHLILGLNEHRRERGHPHQPIRSGLVWRSRTGGPLEPDLASKRFKKLCARAGLGDCHVHQLRHSAASLMLAEEIPLEVVSKVLGHSGIRVTADVYGHLTLGQKRSAIEAMERALGRRDRRRT